VTYGALVVTALGMTMTAQTVPMGFAWDVTGKWQVNGRASDLKAGDPLAPGSLVVGFGALSQHVIVLLPDGQRLLLECHDQPSCSRGFRLPALTQQPDNETIGAFQQVSLLRGQAVEASNQSANDRPPMRQPPGVLHAEGVAALETDGTANIAPVIAPLPPGDYRLVLKSDSGSAEQAVHWEGKKNAIRLAVKQTGLCKLTFYGSLNVERMRATVLVVPPLRFGTTKRRLDELRETLTEWNEHSPGWPLHDFLALYLEALKAEPASQPQAEKSQPGSGPK
jgi:hypothetical protein